MSNVREGATEEAPPGRSFLVKTWDVGMRSWVGQHCRYHRCCYFCGLWREQTGNMRLLLCRDGTREHGRFYHRSLMYLVVLMRLEVSEGRETAEYVVYPAIGEYLRRLASRSKRVREDFGPHMVALSNLRNACSASSTLLGIGLCSRTCKVAAPS